MSANLLLYRRPAPQRAEPSPVAQPHSVAWAQSVVEVAAQPHPAVVDQPHPLGIDWSDAPITAVPDPALPARSRSTLAVEPVFAARNSPVDLLFRGLWQLVGVYVYLVLVVKDRKLPR